MYTTRSGRTVKQPARFEPVDKVEDDDDDDDEEEDEEEDLLTEDEEDDDDEEEDDEEDADEYGNLKGFVVPDDEDT
jgi:hypothetical protein